MWTTEEIRQLNLALASQNASEITRLMNIYQQEIPSKEKFLHLKKIPHYLLAFQIADTHNVELSEKLINFYFKNSSEIKRVLSYICRPQTTAGLNSADLDILYHLYSGLEYLAFFDHLKLFDNIFKQYPFDLSFVIPTQYSLAFKMNTALDVTVNQLPLIFRLAVNGKEDWVKVLLSPKYKINIDTEIELEGIKGVTLLYYLCKISTTPSSLIQLLIDHGANPYHPIKIKNRAQEVNSYTLLQLLPNTKPQFEKLKQCLANKKPVVEEIDSAEHSDGASANSAGSSPKDSPNRPSLLTQDSPPHMSIESRRGSPTNSPMQLTDSDSSGSSPPRNQTNAAVISPERVNTQPQTLVQDSVPPGNTDLDEDFYRALRNNKFDYAKALYDTGRVRLKTSYKHNNKQKNVLQIVLTDFQYKELRSYLLYHTKYPADINSTNTELQTALHLKMCIGSNNLKGLPNREAVIGIMQTYADKQPNVNAKDNEQNTPLHIAAASGGTESHQAVDELIRRGASIELRNREGLTAEQYCEKICPDEESKKKVLAVFKEHSPKQATSISLLNTNSASPILYTGNKSTMFSNPNGAHLQVVSEPLNKRNDARTVGALYAPPPAASVELPKLHKNDEKPIDSKKSIGSKLKSLFQK